MARMYELLNVFGEVLERCTGTELHESHTLDTDTLFELSTMSEGESRDLPGFEGAVMVRRVV